VRERKRMHAAARLKVMRTSARKNCNGSVRRIPVENEAVGAVYDRPFFRA
jgi:hypothetical protein